MATHRLFTELVVSATVVMMTMTGGIAGAAPVVAADKCVASTLAFRRLAVPASQRYVVFKEAQIEQAGAANELGSNTDGCEAPAEIASPVIRRPLGYVAFKDLQAGNDILAADSSGASDFSAARYDSSLGVPTVDQAANASSSQPVGQEIGD